MYLVGVRRTLLKGTYTGESIFFIISLGSWRERLLGAWYPGAWGLIMTPWSFAFRISCLSQVLQLNGVNGDSERTVAADN